MLEAEETTPTEMGRTGRRFAAEYGERFETWREHVRENGTTSIPLIETMEGGGRREESEMVFFFY
jgi:hypothetical protein